MFEHFAHPSELLAYRLGSALTMEHDSLDMLGELEQAAQSDEIKKMFSHHAEETRQQIKNLERTFELLNIAPNDSPSPTTKGLAKEGSSLVHKTEPALLDSVVLSAALETEHYEIAVYQSLITAVGAMDAREAQSLLQENLEQEQHTSNELNEMARKVAHAV